jgi:hypothetical protein
MEMPSDWTLQEINRRGPSISSITGHDCASYLATSQDGVQSILLEPMCDAGGGESWNGPCPEGGIFISDDVMRYPDQFTNSYRYGIFEKGDNNTCLGLGVMFVAETIINAQYSRTDMNYTSIVDFNIPDRIILSLR